MNTTDEVQRLLDELRNLASDVNEAEIRSHSVIDLIQGQYNRCFVLDMNHDWLNAWHAEFERILQAIAATLGTGTCENTEQIPLAWSFTCSECGVHSITEGERFNYCPNCGRKVVDG